MADKISTLILKVDLDCPQCYKKIKKVLCRLQEKEDVKAIIYDEKNKTVTIAGAFNAEKVSDWLCCKACKIIKEIDIKDDKPKGDNKPNKNDNKPKDEKPKNDKPKDEKPKDDKPKKDDQKPKNDKPKDDKTKTVKFKLDEKPKDEKPKNDKPKDNKPKEDKPEGKPKLIPQKAQPEPLKTEPYVVGGFPQISYQPGWPGPPPAGLAGPAGPCCFRPVYEGYFGGCRCCTCGRVNGYMAGTGAPMGYYGGAVPMSVPYGEYKGCQYFCEEDPVMCSVM